MKEGSKSMTIEKECLQCQAVVVVVGQTQKQWTSIYCIHAQGIVQSGIIVEDT